MSTDKPAWQSKRLWTALATVIAILIVAWRPEFALHETAIADEIAKVAMALIFAFTAQDTIVGSTKAYNTPSDTVDISDIVSKK